MTHLETAFNVLLDEGIYPGPTRLARRMGRSSDSLSGPECHERRRLMRQHNIPFKRNSPYGRAGKVPHAQTGAFMTDKGFWVYAVEYSNYEPPETHSLYSTEELAQEHCAALNRQAYEEGPSGSDNWDVNKRWVHGNPV